MVVRVIKNILWVLILALLLLGVPRLSGAFAWISVHHIAQALIFILIA